MSYRKTIVLIKGLNLPSNNYKLLEKGTVLITTDNKLPSAPNKIQLNEVPAIVIK